MVKLTLQHLGWEIFCKPDKWQGTDVNQLTWEDKCVAFYNRTGHTVVLSAKLCSLWITTYYVLAAGSLSD